MSHFLVLLDVDSTLIEEEAIDLLAEAAGSRDVVAAITASAMNGEVDFERSLRDRVATLTGLHVRELSNIASNFTVTNGAEELIAGVQSAGGRVCAISGGFHQLLDPLAAELGLDRWRANNLEIVDGLISGQVVGRVIDGLAKAKALREWAQIYGIPLRDTVAIGDGANDLPMLKEAGLGVAFDAKPTVREKADVIITERDLSQVLPFLASRNLLNA